MDISLNYREAGSGFPLILLHGNGEDSSYFEHQIPYFAERYHVFAIDTRGHGGTPRGTAPFTFDQFAKDLRGFMDEHGLFRAHILGFSDGAITALLFALDNSERVDRLVLNGANLDTGGLIEEVRVAIHERAVRYEKGKDEGPEELFRYECYRLMDTQPAIDPKRLAVLDRPTLVIAGTNDMITQGHTQLIYESLGNAELSILPGDHFIAAKEPELFNKTVDTFLRGALASQD